MSDKITNITAMSNLTLLGLLASPKVSAARKLKIRKELEWRERRLQGLETYLPRGKKKMAKKTRKKSRSKKTRKGKKTRKKSHSKKTRRTTKKSRSKKTRRKTAKRAPKVLRNVTL